MYAYSMLDPHCCRAPLVADFIWSVAIKQFCLWPVLVSLVHRTQLVQWLFVPENAPHHGGIYEAAVCSMKIHLRCILWPVKLNFEELSTILSQVEACMNSRPLVALPPDDDGVEALTPGHFLITSKLIPICLSFTLLSLFCVVLHLTQSIKPLFITSGSTGRLSTWAVYRKYTNGIYTQRMLQWMMLSLCVMIGCNPPSGHWYASLKYSLVRITLYSVVKLKTSSGTYTCPITKVAVLMPV